MNVDTLNLATANEGGLYFIIHELGGAIWRIEHDLADGRCESTPELTRWLQKARKVQQEAVAKLDEFGIDTNGGEPTKEYRDWYSWWRNWDKALSGSEKEMLSNALDDCDSKNVWAIPDEFKPSGNQKDAC